MTCPAFIYADNIKRGNIRELNNFAISSTGIGEAMQRSASALFGAGNTLEESIGLITAANAIVQNPESVGTAMKTLTMYLRAAKTELEDAGESSEGCADSVSKLREQLMQLTGVDIMLDENTFKSTYQIIKEISEVWDELSDATQANVTGLIAGKRNANVVQALMTNFEDAENAMQTAADAAGSAFMENEKYLDSIAGKIEVLKGQFQALSQGVIGDGSVKFLLDMATAVLQLANNLNKIHLLLPLIVGSVNTIIGRGMAADVAKLTTQTSLLLTTGRDAGGVMQVINGNIAGLSASQRALFVQQLQSIAANEQLSAGYREQAAALATLITEQTASAAAGASASTSLSAMWTALPAFGKISLILTAVSTLLGLIVPAITQVDEKAIEAANDIVNRYNEAEETYRSNIDTIEGMRDRFEELSKGVGENGENISLTNSEYQEYKGLLDQLIDISPGILTQYNEQGEAVANYSTALSDAIEKQREYIDNERQIYLSEGQKAFKGKQAEFNNYANQLRKAGDELYTSLGGGGLSGGHSLGDVLGGRAKEQLEALEKALKDIGATEYIDKLDKLGMWGGDHTSVFSSSYNDLRAIYENWESFKASLVNSGQYTEDEITRIQDAIYGLAGPLSAMNQSQADVLDYFEERAKDWDWYKLIPIEALDEVRDGMAEALDMRKSFQENEDAVNAFGDAFEEAVNSKAGKALRDMAEGLADGKGNVDAELEAYNKAVEEFRQSIIDNGGTPELADALVAYFYSFTDAARGATPAIDETTASLKGLKDALEQLQSGYELLGKAWTEMDEDGGLSPDTVKSIQNALGEDEKLTDYLYTENGALKLNTEAWEERSRAIMENDIAALEDRITKLQGDNGYRRERSGH